MSLVKVVLPDPLRPTMPMTEPAAILKLALSRAVVVAPGYLKVTASKEMSPTKVGRKPPASARPSGVRFITSPIMRTDKAVSWYSFTKPTMAIRGPTTRPEIIWNAISAPTLSV